MNYHLASVVCTDWDIDLIPHWIRHHAALGLDSYRVWLNSPGEKWDTFRTAHNLFFDAGWTIGHIVGSYTAAEIRSETLGGYQKTLGANEVLVTVDSDEFLMVEGSRLRDMMECGEYEAVAGVLVDRYDHTLHDARPDVPLADQFPFVGDIQQMILAKHPELIPMMKRTVSDKIVASFARIPIDHSGAHPVGHYGPMGEAAVCPDIVDIYHYSWRSTALDRVAAKPYNPIHYTWFLGEMFGMTDEELRARLADHIREAEAAQTAKGWS